MGTLLGTEVMYTWKVVVFSILLCICGVSVTQAQSASGRLNIDCGAPARYYDPTTGLSWDTDASFISTGKTAKVVLAASSWAQSFTEAKHLRYFDDTRGKNCYELPTRPNIEYLLKATFYYGNYDNAANPPSFQLALDGLIVDDVSTASDNGHYWTELLFLSKGTSTSFCLVRTSPVSTPFVSSISLMPSGTLTSNYIDAYKQYIVDGYVIRTIKRVNMGGTTLIRYPYDAWDRMWFPHSEIPDLLSSTTTVETLKTTLNIVAFDAPTTVMQSAISTSQDLRIALMPVGWNGTLDIGYFSAYYAELAPLTDVPRRFRIVLAFTDGVKNINWNGTTNVVDAVDLMGGPVIPSTSTAYFSNVNASERGPILNAMSFFTIRNQKLARTTDRDAVALNKIKLSLNLTEWTGDPCLPIAHEWVTCSPSPTAGWTQPQVTALNFSGYNLEGTIPSYLNELVGLTSLKLDNNKLTGYLPDLSSLQDLQILNLDNNDLTGELPNWVTSLRNLRELTLQNNNFIGTIPESYKFIPKLVYKPGNPQLIDNALDGPTVSKGAIAGIVVAGIVGLVLVILLIFLVVCLRNRNSTNANVTATNGSSAPGQKSVGAKVYTFAEVSYATKKFQTEIGKGGFGPVYHGKLRDGQEVAVKVAKESQETGEFFNEVEVLSTIRHKNLVTLIGYCEEVHQILIYEYMENGSLYDHLFGNLKSNAGGLDWSTRLSIALDAAKGLAYLHTGCDGSLVHRDIKSTNILLTAKFGAKVADFGVAKLLGDDSKVLTLIKGTAGYMDPEYYTTHYLTAKSDVYSFGVVLLELLTGRASIDRSNTNKMYPNNPDWVRQALRNGNVREVLDPALKNFIPEPPLGAIWKVAEIAMQCVEPQSKHRPSIQRVVDELYLALEVEESGSVDNSSKQFDFSIPEI